MSVVSVTRDVPSSSRRTITASCSCNSWSRCRRAAASRNSWARSGSSKEITSSLLFSGGCDISGSLWLAAVVVVVVHPVPELLVEGDGRRVLREDGEVAARGALRASPLPQLGHERGREAVSAVGRVDLDGHAPEPALIDGAAADRHGSSVHPDGGEADVEVPREQVTRRRLE